MALKINEIAAALSRNAAEQDKLNEVLKPLKEEEEKLRETMLATLKKNRLTSFKSEDAGILFTRAFRSSLAIIDDIAALKWASEARCIKVDTVKANKMLKGTGALPEGFEQKETEYLTVTNKPE